MVRVKINGMAGEVTFSQDEFAQFLLKHDVLAHPVEILSI